MDRPEFVTDEHLTYLDELHESGEIIMYGAAPYLQRKFNMSSRLIARNVVLYWMETFEERHNAESNW